MKEKFKSINFQKKARSIITICDHFISGYLNQDLKLTLRQLYYQLVTQNIIPNKEKYYAYLSKISSNGRLTGLLDWEGIEDRIRVPMIPLEFDDLDDLINTAINSYRLKRQEGQRFHIELWIEKDAIAGVLYPIAKQLHITMMINRGYSSQTAMYDAANRFKEVINREEKIPVIQYLGDFDPSGEDMVRDIKDRLNMFGVNIQINKIALNIEQIKQYKIPPNPTKKSDPRAKEFIKKYGSGSWEVDALPPKVLRNLVIDEVSQLIDESLLKPIKVQEKKDIKKLKTILSGREI